MAAAEDHAVWNQAFADEVKQGDVIRLHRRDTALQARVLRVRRSNERTGIIAEVLGGEAGGQQLGVWLNDDDFVPVRLFQEETTK